MRAIRRWRGTIQRMPLNHLTIPSSPAPGASASASVASPCVRRCTLDEGDVCVGCGRTLDDIRQWREMTEAERADCVARAAQRRQAREAAWQPAAMGDGAGER